MLFDEHIYGHLVKFSQKVTGYLDCWQKTQFQFNIKKIKYVT